MRSRTLTLLPLGLFAAVIASACSADVLERGPLSSPFTTGDVDGSQGGPGCTAACCPKSDRCYVNGQTGPGSECLAIRDNTGQKRIQLRQTWSRVLKPIGLAVPTIYAVLSDRSQLPLEECNMLTGTSGYIQLLDFDLEDADPAKHTLVSGFADYVTDVAATEAQGLCFAALTYHDPAFALTQAELGQAGGEPQPWTVGPVTYKRVLSDFTSTEARDMKLPLGDGIFFLDEARGEFHAFTSRVYVLSYDSVDVLIAMPARDIEFRGRFNDETNNCIGAYRGDALDPAAGCVSQDAENPAWGCAKGGCPKGEGPQKTEGYFLITDLEQVYSNSLQATLCVYYPTQDRSTADGWADPAGWGLNCQNSPKWNTADPVNGIPNGDWCSKTNAPATKDCHDAYRIEQFTTYAGFPIKDGPCERGTFPKP